jgi:hypothetical protein
MSSTSSFLRSRFSRLRRRAGSPVFPRAATGLRVAQELVSYGTMRRTLEWIPGLLTMTVAPGANGPLWLKIDVMEPVRHERAIPESRILPIAPLRLDFDVGQLHRL